MRTCLVVVLLAVVGCHPPGWGKDDDPTVDGATTTDAAASDGTAAIDGGDLDAAASCVRTFRLEGFGTATTAVVTGDFVGWVGTAAEGAVAMTLGADQAWTAERTFAAGTYQYRFNVDGTWMTDPANPNQVPNGLGGFNSVVSCP